jgi:hypothetical protein
MKMRTHVIAKTFYLVYLVRYALFDRHIGALKMQQNLLRIIAKILQLSRGHFGLVQCKIDKLIVDLLEVFVSFPSRLGEST